MMKLTTQLIQDGVSPQDVRCALIRLGWSAVEARQAVRLAIPEPNPQPSTPQADLGQIASMIAEMIVAELRAKYPRQKGDHLWNS
jgi:hypothetical protein